MIPQSSAWWILLGICSLSPNPTNPTTPGETATPKTGMEPPEFPPEFPPELPACGVTFRAPDPCGVPADPAASRRELEDLRELLEASKASLRELGGKFPAENGSRFQEVVADAIPAIREANLEFRESLENVRRELEEHVAREEQPGVIRKKEELRKGVRLLSHVLLLTSRLAQSLEFASQRIHSELSRGFRSLRSQEQP